MKKLFAILLAFGLLLSCAACVNPFNGDNATNGDITDGNVTSGNVTDGNATDGNMIYEADPAISVTDVNTDLFNFVIENAERNHEEEVWGVKVAAENKTDDSITFTCEDCFVNDVPVEIGWNFTLEPMTADCSFIFIRIGELEKLEIDEIRNFKFSLIAENEDGELIEDTIFVFDIDITPQAVSEGSENL